MNYILYILSSFLAFGCNVKSSSAPPGKPVSDSIAYRKLTDAQRLKYKLELYRAYDSMLGTKNFNGSIIVAKNGEVLLEEYVGYSDFRNKDTITASTPFHIASVSKTFTGIAVLKLWEQGRLQLEDTLQKFFPGFPYTGITVRMLLNHRSGLPNYVYFMPQLKEWKLRNHVATNNDMLECLIQNKPAVNNLPGRNFHYCNTNFALLALIVERVSGESFPSFMRSNIFAPLGMKNSFVFSITDTANYKPSYLYPAKPIGLENIDCIYGDKNVYTTPNDLLLWDKALYDNKVVSKGTYEEATRPYSFERPSIHNYGLGFRLMMLPDNKIVYHNGWWHGNNAVFTRIVKDTATIIILGNRYNKSIYGGMHIGDVFKGTIETPMKTEE